MILRRFMQHVREQNWFAVGIDVIIVIVGIYLGFQVTEWGNEQAEHKEERQMLRTLSLDVEEVLGQKLAESAENDSENEEIYGALRVIFEESEASELTQAMCRRIAVSSSNNWRYIPLSSAEEIIASGKLDLIKNDQVRLQMMQYRTYIERNLAQASLSRQSAVSITPNHSDVILMKRIGDEISYECDVSAMRTDDDFKNDFTSNTVLHSNAAMRTEYEIGLLENLKTSLDAETQK